MKSLEDRKREIIKDVCWSHRRNLEFTCKLANKTIDQALTQLNALDKPRIDEGKCDRCHYKRSYLARPFRKGRKRGGW